MSYDNAEPKVLKTLNSNGQVLDDNGNVIGETSDYWVRTYNQTEPKVDKILHSDGTIKDSAGNLIQDTTEFNVKKYNQAEPIPAKYLHADGTIDENAGGGGADLEDNHQATIDVSTYTEPVEIEPASDKDGMKKATITLSNVPIPGSNLYAWKAGGSVIYTATENPELTSEIYGCISSEGLSLFADMTSDSFKIIQIVGNVLRVGSDSEHWAPYERNNNYDTNVDGIKLEDDKTVTIDVSQYSESVEIYPSIGKETMFDAMKKVTVTLSNIPSGGATAYAWVNTDNTEDVYYTNFDIAPETLTNEKEIYTSDGVMTVDVFTPDGYEKISDSSFSVVARPEPVTYTRDSTKDFTLWQLSE